MRTRSHIKSCTASKAAWAAWVGLFIASGEVARAGEADLLFFNFPHKTSVAIVGEDFYINGEPTYAGRMWNNFKIEGLLLNCAVVQGIFDDRNPKTVSRWAYPDTGQWDPARNTREFVAAMGQWRRHGLMAISLNLQGGRPVPEPGEEAWDNSAFEPDGSIRAEYLVRLEQILNRADELGMVVILGYFYSGQDERLRDEAAVVQAADNMTRWLLQGGYRNVLVEINHECDLNYDHAILRPDRVHELIMRVRNTTEGKRRLYVGTSFSPDTLPTPNVARVSDFLLVHARGTRPAAEFVEFIRRVRQVPSLFPKPLVITEDENDDFDKPENHLFAALREHVSWGFLDRGRNNYHDGFQCPPVRWEINTERKFHFFRTVAEVTGSPLPIKPWTQPVIVKYPDQGGQVTIWLTNYHGWSGAYTLDNGHVRTVVVPAVGRVMQFGFLGQQGVFWENRKLDGRAPDWNAQEWMNFGGDKAWPAPESEWERHMEREWRPPPAFDARPFKAELRNDELVLTSEVDPFYGIRVTRRVRVHPVKPQMTIRTTFEKVEGQPVMVSVWVATQVQEPKAVCVPAPKSKRMSQGYVVLTEEPPPGMEVSKGWITLKRDRWAAHKIGTQAGDVVWMDDKQALHIHCPRIEEVVYPDQESSVAVYTSPDPLRYVQLETRGPLYILRPGDRITHTNSYTLYRLTGGTPLEEARRIVRGR